MMECNSAIKITLYRDGRVRLTKAAAIYFNIVSTADLRPGSASG
ncbi:hypothetical protein [Hymenobacter sp. HSC-4F20]|nr:hypothetical protein [Hymenobacter sp. HSC-4F20]